MFKFLNGGWSLLCVAALATSGLGCGGSKSNPIQELYVTQMVEPGVAIYANGMYFQTGKSFSIAPGGSTAFSVAVANQTNQSVTWATTIGTIDGNGIFTAPASNGTGTLTATSVADPAQSSFLTLTVQPAGPLAVLSQGQDWFPSGSTMITFPGVTQPMAAQVFGTANQGVVWSTTIGTIDQSGNFFAGSSAGAGTLTATCDAYPGQACTINVTVQPLTVQLLGTYSGTLFANFVKTPIQVTVDVNNTFVISSGASLVATFAASITHGEGLAVAGVAFSGSGSAYPSGWAIPQFHGTFEPANGANPATLTGAYIGTDNQPVTFTVTP